MEGGGWCPPPPPPAPTFSTALADQKLINDKI